MASSLEPLQKQRNQGKRKFGTWPVALKWFLGLTPETEQRTTIKKGCHLLISAPSCEDVMRCFFFTLDKHIFFQMGCFNILHVSIWNSKSWQVPPAPPIPNQLPRRNKALLRDYPPRYLNNLLIRACFFWGVGALRGSSLGFP